MTEPINIDATEVHIRGECFRCHGSGEQPYSYGRVCSACGGAGNTERWVPLLDFMRAIKVQREAEECEFCFSTDGPIVQQDMGEGRVMSLCANCQQHVLDGIWHAQLPSR